MAGKNVKVDIGNIDKVKKEMLNKISDIEKILVDTEKKIEESVNFFDTPTAKYFRDKVNAYIGEQRLAVTQDIKPFVEDCLGSIIKIYEEEYAEEKNIIDAKRDSGVI